MCVRALPTVAYAIKSRVYMTVPPPPPPPTSAGCLRTHTIQKLPKVVFNCDNNEDEDEDGTAATLGQEVGADVTRQRRQPSVAMHCLAFM